MTEVKKRVKGVRNTVTISFSCKPDTYRKIMLIKDALDAEKLNSEVPLSHVIDRLVNLGFAYREILMEQKQQLLTPFKQEELNTK